MRLYLRWVSSYPNENWEDVQTGLEWGLSLMGASLPKSCMKKAMLFQENNCYLLDFNELGFSEEAKKALRPLLQTLKNSEEYRRHGSMDIGRFLVFTLHSPWHYYSVTAVPRNFAQFQQLHPMDSALLFPVQNSCVSVGKRIVEFEQKKQAQAMAFIAKEKHLDSLNLTEGVEVFDVMPNGQLRFAIYDEKGELAAASPLYLGNAGKPGKCMWCHESKISQLFAPNPDEKGYLSTANFETLVKKMNTELLAYQISQNSEIDWKNPHAHTRQEWLYIGFMEPNLQRIATEWGLSEGETFAKIKHLPTHKHEEFEFFGACYHRKDIDALAPYPVIRVSESVREPNGYEPAVR